MFDRALDCFAAADAGIPARPVHAVRPDGLHALLSGLPPGQAGFLRDCGFSGRRGEVALLADGTGLAGAVLGLGQDCGPHVWGALATALPPGSHWRLAGGLEDAANAVLGFALGAYRFDGLRRHPAPDGPKLVLPQAGGEIASALSAARATWLVRDLVNTPANLLGPESLAQAARDVLCRAGAQVHVITSSLLEQLYPVLHAVGCGAARPPHVVIAQWRGSHAGIDAPIVSLCGKGVCFDTGGYDLKPAAGMLRMKKDMAGAATCLGLARMIMDADLPVRLEIRLGCVENMISGAAMRPLDIVKSRTGLAIEIGNTDAEGRLVLCDLLAEACASQPYVLLDFATLTGAARVALGPDLPALFSNDDVLAADLLHAGNLVHDPLWRLPLWDGYNSWLESGVGDLNNVSEKAQAGAIIAALFLQRFVSAGTRWAHVDVYGWNDAARPGAPAGGEAQAMRAAFRALSGWLSCTVAGDGVKER
jgi:leucyl aminopeptidase